MNIFITGASGRLANYVIDYIQKFKPEINLFGLVRSATSESTKDLNARGLTTRVGDYTDRDSLVKAFQDMDRLLFISFPNSEMSKNVVSAAKEANIKFIAYTSVNGIEYPKTGLELNHRQTEKLIKDTGIPHTFIRNSLYLEMELGALDAAINTGNYYYLSDGKISYSLRQEYAEVAAKIISNADYPEVVEIGRKAVTHAELAHVIEKAIGRNLNIKKVDDDTYQAWLKPYSKTGFEYNMEKYVQKGNNGEDEVTTTDFEKILGHPLPSLESAITTMLNLKTFEVNRSNDKDFKGYK